MCPKYVSKVFFFFLQSIFWSLFSHSEYIIKMENDNELKKIYIKNRTCYYFDDNES